MNKSVYNVVDIESLMFDRMIEMGFDGDLIFMSNRPYSVESKMDKFYVIRSSTNIQDLDAIGNGIISIEFYARDINGFRDSNSLSESFKSISDSLPFRKDKYFFSYQNVTPSYSDRVCFHYQIVNIRTLIKDQ